ncbi:MAG: dihydropteroate synthase [Neisseriales bacterium]|nr:MAG: dihydropteroate synthase [Neisseriales bacterium]
MTFPKCRTDRFRCGRFEFALSRPLIMGVLNITPDSFSDGNRFYLVDAAMAHAERMVEEGVDIIDVGGESTRPQAKPINHQEELDRISPVLEKLQALSVPISLDTRHATVMAHTINNHWVDMINDVHALENPHALEILAAAPTIGICLMHMQGTPASMQCDPSYQDVVKNVSHYLKERVAACWQSGIATERVLVDPGFGFGKTFSHNMTLLHHIKIIQKITGRPVLAGLSRKSMLGTITKESVPSERLGASIAIALEAIKQGATMVRVHDVKPTKQAIEVYLACR